MLMIICDFIRYLKSSVAVSYTRLIKSGKAYARELIRPWKLVTFGIAMSWLLYGAISYNIADWDVGVTLLMGGLTYLTAPWSVYIILSGFRYRPRFWLLHMIVALLVGLFVVDWVYMAYHAVVGNQTFRDANVYASAPLYFMAGAVWLYRGSVKEFIENIRKLG